MRYSVYLNGPSSQKFEERERIEFRKMNKKHLLFKNARTLVRPVDDLTEQSAATRYASAQGDSLRADVNAKVGKEVGLKANQRYVLKAHGNTGWFLMVPVERVVRGKPPQNRTEPMITVTART